MATDITSTSGDSRRPTVIIDRVSRNLEEAQQFAQSIGDAGAPITTVPLSHSDVTDKETGKRKKVKKHQDADKPQRSITYKVILFLIGIFSFFSVILVGLAFAVYVPYMKGYPEKLPGSYAYIEKFLPKADTTRWIKTNPVFQFGSPTPTPFKSFPKEVEPCLNLDLKVLAEDGYLYMDMVGDDGEAQVTPVVWEPGVSICIPDWWIFFDYMTIPDNRLQFSEILAQYCRVLPGGEEVAPGCEDPNLNIKMALFYSIKEQLDANGPDVKAAIFTFPTVEKILEITRSNPVQNLSDHGGSQPAPKNPPAYKPPVPPPTRPKETVTVTPTPNAPPTSAPTARPVANNPQTPYEKELADYDLRCRGNDNSAEQAEWCYRLAVQERSKGLDHEAALQSALRIVKSGLTGEIFTSVDFNDLTAMNEKGLAVANSGVSFINVQGSSGISNQGQTTKYAGVFPEITNLPSELQGAPWYHGANDLTTVGVEYFPFGPEIVGGVINVKGSHAIPLDNNGTYCLVSDRGGIYCEEKIGSVYVYPVYRGKVTPTPQVIPPTPAPNQEMPAPIEDIVAITPTAGPTPAPATVKIEDLLAYYQTQGVGLYTIYVSCEGTPPNPVLLDDGRFKILVDISSIQDARCSYPSYANLFVISSQKNQVKDKEGNIIFGDDNYGSIGGVYYSK